MSTKNRVAWATQYKKQGAGMIKQIDHLMSNFKRFIVQQHPLPHLLWT